MKYTFWHWLNRFLFIFFLFSLSSKQFYWQFYFQQYLLLFLLLYVCNLWIIFLLLWFHLVFGLCKHFLKRYPYLFYSSIHVFLFICTTYFFVKDESHNLLCIYFLLVTMSIFFFLPGTMSIC